MVLPGAGGGLGHLAVQYAVTRGLRVIAIGGLFLPLPVDTSKTDSRHIIVCN